jgi:protein-S-isoprenylcysteine O-methyltransferase Ste14
MRRATFFAYAVACHGLFLGVYAYMAGFFANLGVPKSVDSPADGGSIGWAVVINLALVAVFGIQHSVMARPAFKQRWTRIVPQPIERSTYVLLSNAAVALLLWQWRPIDIVLWDAPAGPVSWLLWTLFAAGWLMVPAVSLMINHFDLFGTRQAWLHLRGREYEPLSFRTPWLYAVIRHPLYVGWALAFFATPTMTVGHLLLAVSLSVYMVIGMLVEERDLLAHFGRQYETYVQNVPRFIPSVGRLLGRRKKPTLAAEAENA